MCVNITAYHQWRIPQYTRSQIFYPINRTPQPIPQPMPNIRTSSHAVGFTGCAVCRMWCDGVDVMRCAVRWGMICGFICDVRYRISHTAYRIHISHRHHTCLYRISQRTHTITHTRYPIPHIHTHTHHIPRISHSTPQTTYLRITYRILVHTLTPDRISHAPYSDRADRCPMFCTQYHIQCPHPMLHTVPIPHL